MKAVRFHEYGDPGVLRYEDVQRPAPSAGEVLVEGAATSFNPVDAGIRAGRIRFRRPPAVHGLSAAGRIRGKVLLVPAATQN